MENQEYFEKIIEDMESAELGKIFGKLCGKINKKSFVGFFQDEMVFKLGKEEVDLLKVQYEGAKNWDPSGMQRGMKDWIQVPAKYRDEWEALAIRAKEYCE